MDTTRYYAGFLAAMMLLSGSLNTIFLKFQNYQQFECEPGTYNCTVCEDDSLDNNSGSSAAGECIDFEQPVYQTSIMFIGETLCFVTYYSVLLFRRYFTKDGHTVKETSLLTGFRKLLFFVPTLCDLTATTLMNVGLIYTTASVYQMLRGAVVVFTGILSVIFLKRTQYPFHILGMVFVVAGVTIVGLASILFQESGDAKNPILGDTMVIIAQLFTACQFVFEEKYLAKYNVPALQGVGFEGVYGIISLAVIAPILQVTAGDAGGTGNLFDILFAFNVFKYPAIWVSTVGCAISIAFFNFFGLSVTKVLGATSRTTIDACRTLTVWIFSLSVGWETFAVESFFVQLAGFSVLLLGTMWYNQVLKVPFLNYAKYEERVAVEQLSHHPPTSDEEKPLLTDGTTPKYYSNDDFRTPDSSPEGTPTHPYTIQ